MPVVTMNVWEEVLDGTVEPRLIEALTAAVVDVLGDPIRPSVIVNVVGVPQTRWGIGGVPATEVFPLTGPGGS